MRIVIENITNMIVGLLTFIIIRIPYYFRKLKHYDTVSEKTLTKYQIEDDNTNML